MHDSVIRGGTIIDGTGGPAFGGDVAIDGGIITSVGKVDERGRREIEAKGLLVTPGFVDIHTHYDGQVTWDSELAPSSWHGVTSVVMGNCGVGFAPCAPDQHDFLIALMEGVEDIPGTALAEGLPWDWESFTEYLDAVERRTHAIDLGAEMPHAALRAYVMGERGADHEIDPTVDEIETMSRLVKEALLAGAVGFASSRNAGHRTRDGQTIGSLTASTEELLGIGQALRETGRGVFQLVTDFSNLDNELAMMRRLAGECGRPLSFSFAQGADDRWRKMLRFMETAADDGIDIKGQIAARPIGLLLGLQSSMNPFMLTPSYQAIADLPLAERVARMRSPELREQMLAEQGRYRATSFPLQARVSQSLESLFRLGDPPNYEPAPEENVAVQARQRGQEPAEFVYELMLANDGKELLYFAFANYAGFTLDGVRELVLSDRTLFGLSDGGAHVGVVCDASFPTSNITHWCRDRSRGEKLPLELVIKGQTADTARHVGWYDRGIVAPGFKADLNVIDFDRLQLHTPIVLNDLPAGGRRLMQRADGYRYTLCSGEVTFEDGRHTGVLPGRLVRGAEVVPA